MGRLTLTVLGGFEARVEDQPLPTLPALLPTAAAERVV